MENISAKSRVENEDKSIPDIKGVLSGLNRPVPIPGMEGESVPDPIAQELLRFSEQDFEAVSAYLAELGIFQVTHLEKAYSSNAVVLDAGEVVVRLSSNEPIPKSLFPYVLQPIALKKIGSLYVQVSKKMETKSITQADVENVQANLGSQGYYWDDAGSDNLGKDEAGNLFILDGSVTKK